MPERCWKMLDVVQCIISSCSCLRITFLPLRGITKFSARNECVYGGGKKRLIGFKVHYKGLWIRLKTIDGSTYNLHSIRTNVVYKWFNEFLPALHWKSKPRLPLKSFHFFKRVQILRLAFFPGFCEIYRTIWVNKTIPTIDWKTRNVHIFLGVEKVWNLFVVGEAQQKWETKLWM